MLHNVIHVLLLGKSAHAFTYLAHWLGNRGCLCLFATSIAEAAGILSKERCDIVLTTIAPHGDANLLESLGESQSSLYYSHMVENDCLWLPVVENGENCLGAPAQRPREFTRKLDQLLRDKASNGRNINPDGIHLKE